MHFILETLLYRSFCLILVELDLWNLYWLLSLSKISTMSHELFGGHRSLISHTNLNLRNGLSRFRHITTRHSLLHSTSFFSTIHFLSNSIQDDISLTKLVINNFILCLEKLLGEMLRTVTRVWGTMRALAIIIVDEAHSTVLLQFHLPHWLQVNVILRAHQLLLLIKSLAWQGSWNCRTGLFTQL